MFETHLCNLPVARYIQIKLAEALVRLLSDYGLLPELKT